MSSQPNPALEEGRGVIPPPPPPPPSAWDVAAVDLAIVDTYIALVQDEMKQSTAAYLDEVRKVRDGIPMPPRGPAGRPTSAPHRPQSARTPRAAALPFGPNWEDGGGAGPDPTAAACSRVAKQMTSVMLEAFKEVEGMRKQLKWMHDVMRGFPANRVQPTAAEARRPTAAPLPAQQIMTEGCSAPFQVPYDSDAIFPSRSKGRAREVLQEVFASSGRAVEALRSGILYGSTVLNNHVRAKPAREALIKILKLMHEEAAEPLDTYRCASERSAAMDVANGVRHLGSVGDAALQEIPSVDTCVEGAVHMWASPANIASWQASVMPACYSAAAATPSPEVHAELVEMMDIHDTATPPTASAGASATEFASSKTSLSKGKAGVSMNGSSANISATGPISRQTSNGVPIAIRKQLALERVFAHSKRICEALDVHVGSNKLPPSPRDVVAVAPVGATGTRSPAASTSDKAFLPQSSRHPSFSNLLSIRSTPAPSPSISNLEVAGRPVSARTRSKRDVH